MTAARAVAAPPATSPAIVPGTELTYGVRGRKIPIGRIFKTDDGVWHAVSPWGGETTHEGDFARWDASHALTLAYMRSQG
jgi:hypothetical protein